MPLALTAPHRLPLIAPSILSADFGFMVRDAAATLAAGADLLHLDVMDGHFVPNLTMGPDMCRWLRKHLPDAHLDVHLMVTDPANFIIPFAKAGASHITFHIEVAGPTSPHPAADLCKQIHDLGLTAGIAINPPTPVETLLPSLLHTDRARLDLALVMSVNPGFSGQTFIPQVLDKVRAISARLGPDQRLEMDGGINPTTAPLCRAAGCDVMVAASAIFSQPASRWAELITELRTGHAPLKIESSKPKNAPM